MRRLAPAALTDIGCALFEAAGCRADDARTVAEHLVESSLFGHDSHGTLRLYEYVDQIRNGGDAGTFDPAGTPRIEHEHGATARLDGGGALGPVAGRLAVDTAARLAAAHGVGSVALRNCSHLGRIGAYPLALARRGLLGLAFVNAGRMGRQIPPFGGLDGRLSTNPIAFCAPRPAGDPILVDMTSSMVAEGKIRVAHNRGQAVPGDWLIDARGRATTDPADYLADPPGAILPLGGSVGYKGTCLSVMVEILGGLLSGEGCASPERTMRSNGLLLTAWEPDCFCAPEDYERELEQLADHLLSSRVDPEVGEIQLPGGPEFRHAAERGARGIPVDDTTWARIAERARRLGLDPEPWEAWVLARD